MIEAILYSKLDKKRVQCGLCNHKCIINDDSVGACNVRKNIGGDLFTLIYGKIAAKHTDPIEKKPFFHFLPGSLTLSISTLGCNFCCQNCQNYEISQHNPSLTPFLSGEHIETPEVIINEAMENNCKSIAYTYTEPTIFIEYALDIMKLAHKKNLKNIWVSNGYMTQDALHVLLPYLDAINVDLKFFNNETYQKITGARLEPILENLKILKKNRVWLEITTLIIPTLNDSEKELHQMAHFISKELGNDTPWHLTAFYPAFKLSHLPSTDFKIIEKAYEIGKKTGLNYVYAGNVMSDCYENTYCPGCNEILLRRYGYKINTYYYKNKCTKCLREVDIIQ